LRLYRPVIRRALTKGVDGVFAVSSLEASYLQRDFSIDPVIVENGVDADIASCKWTPEPGRILYAGRVERYKNIDLAAQMAQGLRKLGYEARLRVIGEGSYLDSLRTKLKGLEVEFSPFLPRREYLEQLCKAALFANLSTHESYPQSVNEAQAVGVPVLLGDPWGHNFDSRSRTMTVKPHQLMEESFLREVGEFMKYAPAQPAPQTPFWDDVVKTKILRAYEESTIDP
jgi:glycosyltransferase involved in cell wall biosynthesis